jgi:hypothetical protein
MMDTSEYDNKIEELTTKIEAFRETMSPTFDKFLKEDSGKDGYPYPVDREIYDHSVQTIKDALDQAKLEKKINIRL